MSQKRQAQRVRPLALIGGVGSAKYVRMEEKSPVLKLEAVVSRCGTGVEREWRQLFDCFVTDGCAKRTRAMAAVGQRVEMMEDVWKQPNVEAWNDTASKSSAQ